MGIRMQIDQLENAYCDTLNSFVRLYDSQNGCEMTTFVGHGGKHEVFVYSIETHWCPEADEGGDLSFFLKKRDTLDTFMRLNTTLALYEGEEMDGMLECLCGCAELMLGFTLYYMQVLNVPFKKEKYRYYELAETIVSKLQERKAGIRMGMIQEQQKANAETYYGNCLKDFMDCANTLTQLLNKGISIKLSASC